MENSVLNTPLYPPVSVILNPGICYNLQLVSFLIDTRSSFLSFVAMKRKSDMLELAVGGRRGQAAPASPTHSHQCHRLTPQMESQEIPGERH